MAIPHAIGPAACLAACLPEHLRYVPEAQAACVWLDDVGAALLALAKGLPQLVAGTAAPGHPPNVLPANAPAWVKES